MDINVLDYVDHEEIRGAILDGIRGYSHDNAERIISNAGYHLAAAISGEHLGDSAAEQITEQCAKVIANLSPTTLFDLGGYGRPQSKARDMLDHAVRSQQDELAKAVRAAIHNLSKREIVEIIKSGKVKMVVE